MSADLINGLFEGCGALLSMLSVRALVRDKQVRGVSVAPVLFFTWWGAWNCVFYPSLGLWWSFAGAVMMLSVNTVWLTFLLMVYQRPAHCKHEVTKCRGTGKKEIS